MPNKNTLYLCILIISVLIFKIYQPTMTTLKYFPIDEEVSFSEIATTLKLKDREAKHPYLIWQIDSSQQLSPYLKHDVGLLYQNGQLKGVQSKWTQEQKQMTQLTEFSPDKDSLYQAISYHYLEFHQTDQQIKSYYQMSTAQLFTFVRPDLSYDSFDLPKSKQEEQRAHTLETKIAEQLNVAWTTLIDHFEINRKLYNEIPLIDLQHYQNQPLPGLSMTDTRRVIAQLWEGLYKNYIIPNSQEVLMNDNVMPLILLDKNLDHLIVLFTDHKQNEQQLIQNLNVKHQQ